ncbi:MAG: hypothetical protein JW940_13680 [Polyangiaceae bacterium]|nr:hypothetical protein [Polyangiaceae bacterium]
MSELCLAVTRRFLGGPAAEDAAQEALLRALRLRERRAIRNPQALLATIARNEALRLASRQTLHHGRRADLDLHQLAGGGPMGRRHR